MKKSLLTIIAVVMMTLSMKAQESGQCGDNLTWNLNANDSTLTISGTGDMWDIGEIHFPFWIYIKRIVIQDGVTSICNDAFNRYSELLHVSLPSTLLSIGDRAFYTAVRLSSVEIPNSVITIGEKAFSSTKIKSLTLGNSVSSIGENAFEKNYYLKHVTIPNSLKTIPFAAFFDCDSLESVDFGDSLVSVEMAAFQGCSLTSITLPETIQSIDNAFGMNNLVSIIIKATIPPECSEMCFDPNTYEQATLFVPIGCKSLYENAKTWKKFVSIVESGEFTNDNFSDNISVFPNPSSDFININCKNMKSIEILSMDGKMIRKVSVSGDYINVNISDLQNGIYLVMIKTEETCMIKEIVKR